MFMISSFLVSKFITKVACLASCQRVIQLYITITSYKKSSFILFVQGITLSHGSSQINVIKDMDQRILGYQRCRYAYAWKQLLHYISVVYCDLCTLLLSFTCSIINKLWSFRLLSHYKLQMITLRQIGVAEQVSWYTCACLTGSFEA